MTFKVILSGFETKEQARGFLDWFEGWGEQDETIDEWIGTGVQCDVQSGMIEHPDGFEYKLQIFNKDEE
jgi:hypothetical protein